MSNNVFANGRELACKAGSGKSIASFPDVCMTPPENPATPPGVPVPYPNTGMANDTTSGSTTVKISGKEVMLKNKSYFKSSTGDEAGAAAKKGLVSSANRGKVYFVAWSMDVKIEGENAVRHLDMTTHNHGSATNTPPWMFLDDMSLDIPKDHPCKKQIEEARESCKNTKPAPDGKGRDCSGTDCQKKMNCILVPKKHDKKMCCSDTSTGHHLLPNCLFQGTRGVSTTNVTGLRKTGPKAYTEQDALCVCVAPLNAPNSNHDVLHDKTKDTLRGIIAKGTLTFDQALDTVVNSHAETFKNEDGSGPQCPKECTKSQLKDSMDNNSTGGSSNIQVRPRDGITRKSVESIRRDAGDTGL